MKILKFEEILKKFSCHCVMNIHVKTVDNDCEYDRGLLEKIVKLIDKYDCKKVRMWKGEFDKKMIDKAHANGIICNVFWADDVDEAKDFLNMGIDTILTNDYNLVSQVIKG